MEVKIKVLGPIATNMYELSDGDVSYIIDPSGTPQEMKKFLKESGKNIAGVLFTHGHVDHVLGAMEIANYFPETKFYLHPEDEKMYRSCDKQSAAFGLPFFGIPDVEFYDKDMIFNVFQVIHTPGHSPGSVSLYVKSLNIVFSGDTLFNQGVGRTDLWGGNWKSLENSIKHKLFTLPPYTTVLSGHGEPTLIGEEKINNPFL
ncbi:MAG: MBL fold metallo-hydrolase [Deltaproteobacteria bacterium]|nr:MBL fold metallo-hydrolase [Deltaproteobacteria bacterium]